MVGAAAEAGLDLKAGVADRDCPAGPDDAHGPVHRMSPAWALLTYRRRRVPPGARVHESVRDRMAADPAYGRRLPPSVVWAGGAGERAERTAE